MVDFQSRDTSRGVDDESEAEATDDGATGNGTDDQTTAETTEAEPTPATADADAPAGDGTSVSVAILITDDEADAADDVADVLAAEYDVLGRDRRTGDTDAIQTAVDTFLDQDAVDAVLTVGGVSVGPSQVTVDAVEPLLDTKLPGFGELFRRRYEDHEGSAALRTRAFAGVAGSTPVFCLPGDGEGARAATAELVVPELEWLVAAATEQ